MAVPMTFKSDSDVKAVLRGIIDHSLPKAEWTHEAHIAAAIALIGSPGYDAARDMPGIIRAYNEATGTPNTDKEGYHHTITLASLRAAKTVYDSRPNGYPLHKIVDEIVASEYGQSKWLLSYWSSEVLFSVTARRQWVAPDIKPLKGL